MSSVTTARPSWIDLATPDAVGAERFYRELLGWEMRRTTTPTGEHRTGMVGGEKVAGITSRPPAAAGVPSSWTVYWWVDDLDAVVAHAAVAGGSVLEAPFDAPDGNRVAMIADPTCAEMGVIAGRSRPDALWSSEPGRACWFELMTRDAVDAVRFYSKLFGWQAVTSDAGGVDYTVFSIGDEHVAGMISRPDDIDDDVADAWSVYFSVADCDEIESKARALGGRVLKHTTPTPMGPFAVIADPRGAVFQVAAFDGPSA